MGLKQFFIEESEKTPQVDLNNLTGELIISGRSIPENAVEFYTGIYNWINLYIKNPRQITNLRLNLEYFNTSSSIWIAKIIKSLCSIKNEEFTLMIHIYFNIEEFDSMETPDLRDALSPVLDMIGSPALNLGIKIYGTGINGEIIKESIVLI